MPFQIACLEENTLIFTRKGAVPIKDIQIGDKIFNEEGVLVTVIKITRSQKRFAVKRYGRVSRNNNNGPSISRH